MQNPSKFKKVKSSNTKKSKYHTAGSRKSSAPCITYKFRAYPTHEQKIFFAKSFGCCRFLWNQYVADESYYYSMMGESLDNTPADYKDDYPFLAEVDNYALNNVQLNYQNAMQAFFNGNVDYPKFKKKGKCKNPYKTNMSHNNIFLEGNMLRLPKIPGKLELFVHREVPDDLKLKSVTVTLESDGAYYVSILYEEPARTTQAVPVSENIEAIGFDMSLPDFFVSSDGFDCHDMMHFFRKEEDRLAKAQKKLSRMQYGSNNYNRQKLKVAKIHAEIKHQRNDMFQKLSTWLVRHYDVICIEDLDMQGMAQSLNFGKSVNDNGWGMFVKMLEYKCNRAGKYFIKIDKWYPSSQTCSVCGYQNHNTKDLSVREWTCPQCGTSHNRDINAFINIRDEGLRLLYENVETALTA